MIKLIGDFFTKYKNEMVSILYKANRSDFDPKGMISYLGSNDIYKMSNMLPMHQYLCVICSLEQFIKDNNININIAASDEDLDENSFPSYKKIKIDNNTDKVVPNEFAYACSIDDFKFLIKCEQGYSMSSEPKTGKIIIYSLRKDETKVNELYDKIDKLHKENNILKNKVLDGSGSVIDIEKLDWDNIVLPESKVKIIKQNTQDLFNKIPLLNKYGINVKRGLLISSEPGMGKTCLGKILANTTDCTFIWISPGFLTAQNVNGIYQIARDLAPTIVFLEDLDLYGAERESNHNSQTLGELMNQLDGIESNNNVITIATTNKLEIIETALKNRPGRFDRIITIDAPNKDCIKRMVQSFTKNIDITNVKLDSIADLAKGLSGAHIKYLVDSAIINAIDINVLDPNDNTLLLYTENFENVIKTVKDIKIQPQMGFRPRANIFDCDEED